DANINARATVDWVNSQLATRDANINARATVDWVNSQLATRVPGHARRHSLMSEENKVVHKALKL
ncbi:hypothetical protein V9P81_26475, partial [Enterobacter hormaechei subsp. hoffmannii]